MGCTTSKTPIEESPEKEQLTLKSKLIDAKIKQEAKESKNTTKLLLLGTGESGKTTILRQARRLYGVPFTDEERDSVWHNCLYSMRVVLEVLPTLGLSLDDEECINAREIVFDEHPYAQRPRDDLITAIALLWQQPPVRQAVEKRSQFQLNDSAEYFFESVHRIGAAHYVPTDDDLLRVRVRTMGIQETILEVKSRTLHFIDVGGQRSERRKWINVFENIQVLLFIIAISEYDQKLREDKTVSRVAESEMLFDQMINSRWFRSSQCIIFFNKVDLLVKKLDKVPLSEHFSDYSAAKDRDFKAASQFLAQRFLSLNKTPDKHLYRHFTCSIDTTQLHRVLKDVIEAQLLAHFQTAVSLLILNVNISRNMQINGQGLL